MDRLLTYSLLGCLRHPTLALAFDPRGRGKVKVRNDKCSDNVWNGKDFIVQIFVRKIFFVLMTSKVFLKHLPGHKEFIGMLNDKIRQCKVLEKAYRQTYTSVSTGLSRPRKSRDVSGRDHPGTGLNNFFGPGTF